jgi:hypothetical protein
VNSPPRDRHGPQPSARPTGVQTDWWLAGGLVALTALRCLPYSFFKPDDFYIYLRFAENLIQRQQLAFNPGEPAYGFTSVLWLTLISFGGAITGSTMLWAKLASLAATAVTPALAALVVTRLSGCRVLAALAGVVVGCNAWLVRWSMSGLEAGLSAALPLAIVLLALRAHDAQRPPVAASVLAGLAPLVRPEMIGLWLLFLMHVLLVGHAPWPKRLRRVAILSVPGLLISGGTLLCLWAQFGRFLPNTAAAKGTMHDPFAAALPALKRIVMILASTSGCELALACLAVFLWLVRREWRPLTRLRDPNGSLLMAAWVVGLIGLYAMQGVSVYTRYLLMILPLVVVGGLAQLGRWWLRRGVHRGVLVILVVGVVAQNTVLDLRLIYPATLAYQESEERVNIELGTWLRDNTPPQAAVAVPDIGAIGLYSQRRIVDMNGLVTPEVIPYRREGRVVEYLEQHPPDYIIDIDQDPRRLLGDAISLELRLLDSRPFHKMFIFQEEPLYYSLYQVLSQPEDLHR